MTTFLDMVRELGAISRDRCHSDCDLSTHRREIAGCLGLLLENPDMLRDLAAKLPPEKPEWRPVVDVPGYEVSSYGRVRSVDRVLMRRDGTPNPLPGVPMKVKVDRDGRPTVNLNQGNRTVSRVVSVLVAAAFIGPRPDDMQVCHNDGNSLNNQVRNLRYDTQSNNQLDCVNHGTHVKAGRSICMRGHLLTPPNLSLAGIKRNQRACAACKKARSKLRNNPNIDMQAESDRYYAEIMAQAEVA